MLGSASSISDTNVIMNTMIADVFSQFADRLEKAADFDSEVTAIIRESIIKHKRIIFNGDGYSEDWQAEAQKRGLLNLPSTVDAVPRLSSDENIALFERHKVLSRAEITSRVDILLENYSKTVHIEALTMIDMMNRDVIPAITAYTDRLCKTVYDKKRISESIDSSVEKELISRLSAANTEIYHLTADLKMAVSKAEKIDDMTEKSRFYHDSVIRLMEDIRCYADSAESVVSKDCWPYPSYGDLLFKI